jgi:hypothetical protein
MPQLDNNFEQVAGGYLKPAQPFDPADVTRRLKIFPVDFVDARRDLGDGWTEAPLRPAYFVSR